MTNETLASRQPTRRAFLKRAGTVTAMALTIGFEWVGPARRAVATAGPKPAAFPAGIGIIDAPVEPLGVEAERVGHPQRDHLAVLERDETIHQVGRRHGKMRCIHASVDERSSQ